MNIEFELPENTSKNMENGYYIVKDEGDNILLIHFNELEAPYQLTYISNNGVYRGTYNEFKAFYTIIKKVDNISVK